MNDKNQRAVFMDVIRVVSTLFIVWYHFLVSLGAREIRDAAELRRYYSSNNMNLVTVAVGLFFMISGAGLMISHQRSGKFHFGKYLTKRLSGILLPYWISFAVFVVVYRITFGYGTRIALFGEKPLWRIVFTLLGIDGYLSQYGVQTLFVGIGEWFLGAIILCYLVFPLLCFCLKKARWITFAVMTALLAFFVFFYDQIPVISAVPVYTNALYRLYEFFLGAFLVTRVPLEGKSSFIGRGLAGSLLSGKWRILYSVVTFPVLIYYWKLIPWLPYNTRALGGRILLQDVCAFLFIAGLEVVFSKANLIKKPLAFIAGRSYCVFLVHHVVIYHLPDMLPMAFLRPSSVVALLAVEAIVIALSAAAVSVFTGLAQTILGMIMDKMGKSRNLT